MSFFNFKRSILSFTKFGPFMFPFQSFVQVANHMNFFLHWFCVVSCPPLSASYLSMICSRFIIKGTASSISLWNASAPGEYPVTCETLVFIACEAVTSAQSTNIFASYNVPGGSVCIKVCKTFPTVWCIFSQIPFEAELRLVFGLSFTPKSFSNFWNSQPMNFPPLSRQQEDGRGYLDSQEFSNFSATCSDVLLSILMSSARHVTLSILVSAENSYILLVLVWTFQGPIKSVRACSQGAVRTSRAGRWSKPLPSTLYFWQASQWKLSIIFLIQDGSIYAPLVIVFAFLGNSIICGKSFTALWAAVSDKQIFQSTFYLFHLQYV